VSGPENSNWSVLGLRPRYDAEELVVLRVPKTHKLPLGAQLRVEGPQPSSTAFVVPPRTAPGGAEFFEFYMLRPGDYVVRSSWFSESTEISVRPREALGFQLEFGIFSGVVVLALMVMVRRYLLRRNKGPKESAA
jgi:hypothetical protein